MTHVINFGANALRQLAWKELLLNIYTGFTEVSPRDIEVTANPLIVILYNLSSPSQHGVCLSLLSTSYLHFITYVLQHDYARHAVSNVYLFIQQMWVTTV